MTEELLDKDGKPIELIKKANQNVQGNYYQKWLDSDRTKFEPTAEDIKCELQLQALDVWEPLKYEINTKYTCACIPRLNYIHSLITSSRIKS